MKPRHKPRPRGIWKVRVNGPRDSTSYSSGAKRFFDHDSENSSSSGCSASNKRQRIHDDFSDDDDEDFFYFYIDQRPWSPSPTHLPARSPKMTPNSKGLDEACTLEDWEDLKALFFKAEEQYEADTLSDTLALLRGVMRECHRFLKAHPDPSVVFNPEPEPVEPPAVQPVSLQVKSLELPTALHSIFGAALFLFGNLIAQDPSRAVAGEPNSAIPYWIAALDVFESGENMQSRTSGIGIDAPQDWRMAVIWGRTLVCLADETLSRLRAAAGAPIVSVFAEPEPNWPQDSPFYTIARRRPPVTHRMSLSTASANDILILAMDQFSRGIFHMPHPQHSQPSHVLYATTSSLASLPDSPVNVYTMPSPPSETFSRAKELFTLASEVLMLSEKFDDVAERQYWASWADSVFSQMKMEGDTDVWRGPITQSRGRCWLIVGSSRSEPIEEQLEKGVEGAIQTEEADEAREALEMAVGFLERAKGLDGDGEDGVSVQKLLAEALLTLANLTPDDQKRNQLYRKAQMEGGEDFGLDLAEDVRMS